MGNDYFGYNWDGKIFNFGDYNLYLFILSLKTCLILFVEFYLHLLKFSDLKNKPKERQKNIVNDLNWLWISCS